MEILPPSRANRWENQMISKKFKNRSCGSRSKKATAGYMKHIPQTMIRGWIRGKATRSGKKTKDFNRSQADLRKIQYSSVNSYQYNGYDNEYDQDILDIQDPYYYYYEPDFINYSHQIYTNKTIQKKKQNKNKDKNKTISKPVVWPSYQSSSSSTYPIKVVNNSDKKWSSSIPKPPIPALPVIDYNFPIQQFTPQPAPVPVPSIPVQQAPARPVKVDNGLIEDIKNEKDATEEKEYSLLGETYLKSMSEIETYGTYSSIEGLCDRSVFSSHKNDKADPTSANFKKIMKEIKKSLPINQYQSINGSMFIRFDENNPRFLQILLSGIDDTPYANGLFLFDIYLSNDYPQKPLKIQHITKGAKSCHANNGPGGFSPNLHQHSGKVCLSLLGTWSGPGWEAGKSNVYQVVSTILFMIFGANHPYYMEPGCGGWEGTTDGRTKHERRVIDYDEEVMYHNAKSAILETLKTPYVGFEDVIKTHFKIKAKYIIKTIQQWIDNKNYTESFRNKIKPIFEEIQKEFKKL